MNNKDGNNKELLLLKANIQDFCPKRMKKYLFYVNSNSNDKFTVNRHPNKNNEPQTNLFTFSDTMTTLPITHWLSQTSERWK